MNRKIHFPSEQYEQRFRRVKTTVDLQVPDRVPLIPQMQAFPIFYAGLTVKEAMSDSRKVGYALDKFYSDFKPDFGRGPNLIYPANIFEACGVRFLRWPGNGLDDPCSMYQYVEGEHMKREEYDEFIHDPTHFIQSKWIPRCFSRFKGFDTLRLRNSLWLGWIGSFSKAAYAETVEAFDSLRETARLISEWNSFIQEYETRLESVWGIPVGVGASCFAPFDLLGDTLRGTINILLDIIECPQLVIRATESLVPIALEAPIAQCKANGREFVWIWLHKGADEFMSGEHYKLFYWPTLRKVIDGLIDAGLTPVLYCEGNYNTRLEILRELPPRRTICHFEGIDMFRAKEILGDISCIAGNVPNTMLAFGTPEETDSYCRRLIEGIGRKGGFMLDSGGLVDNAKPENLRAMFDSVIRYS